jgi:hypothetical protein
LSAKNKRSYQNKIKINRKNVSICDGTSDGKECNLEISMYEYKTDYVMIKKFISLTKLQL